MRFIPIFLLTTFVAAGQFQLRYQQNQTPVYDSVIAYYQRLADIYPQAHLVTTGTTDAGRPLHLFLMGRDLPEGDRWMDWQKGRSVLLVNNGIHAGEPCGVDASLEWSRALLEKQMLPPGVLVAVIPFYNIGGALNRGRFSRANQNGPREYGFRGNARNLDLNRDFIKADALNTRSFYALFHSLQPHIFVDTHTSNGADYQYTMTLISTQRDKLNPVLAQLLIRDLEPFLYREMERAGWPMIPYVNAFGRTPNEGFAAFLETPRYATGYTALFNTIGFVTEAHMLKPYADRVVATQQFLRICLDYLRENGEELRRARQRAFAEDRERKIFDLQWTLDSSRTEKREFRGYQYSYEPSFLGKYDRLRYHSDQPVTYEVPYYPHYRATDSAVLPRYYILPAAWHDVAQRLQYNQIQLRALSRDTMMQVESIYCEDFAFASGPYEGRFPLREVRTHSQREWRQFRKGDYLIPTDQPGRRFLVNVLEPTAADSYLRWSFFNEIFQQKEYFSPYLYEDEAQQMWQHDTTLRRAFVQWKQAHPQLLENPYAVLQFFYKRGPYYEREHLRYPVARIR